MMLTDKTRRILSVAFEVAASDGVTLEQISEKLGEPLETIQRQLNRLERGRIVKLQGDTYSLVTKNISVLDIVECDSVGGPVKDPALSIVNALLRSSLRHITVEWLLQEAKRIRT